MHRTPFTLLAMGLSAALLGSGCSAVQAWKQKSDATDVGTLREQRRAEVVSDFERRRLEAQLRSAQERAEQGDPEAAEEILLSMISRDASNAAARMQLAELYWAHDQLPQATQQLREAIAAAPQRADLHHMLGLVLDAQGHASESSQLLAKAVELEPANQLYRMSAESVGALSLAENRSPAASGVSPVQAVSSERAR